MSDWIFITGGCTFLGSHIAAQIKTVTDKSVMLIDKHGHLYPHITRYCDIFADEEYHSNIISQAIRDYQPKTIIHCGLPEENTLDALSDWDEISNTLALIKDCVNNKVSNFIFFSSSDVYKFDISCKNEFTSVINPQTRSSGIKFAIENILRDAYVSYGLNSVIYRPFKIAGNHNLYDLGEFKKYNSIIPDIINSVITETPANLNGNKFNTNDGTAINDYIHIMDITDTVVNTLQWLETNIGSYTFNIASGCSVSEQDIINTAEQIFGRNINYVYENNDYFKYYDCADISKISETLKFSQSRSIKDMLLDTFKWQNSATYKSLR